jgi:hypothetical protein
MPGMERIRRQPAVLALGVLVAGCALAQPGPAPAPPPAAAEAGPEAPGGPAGAASQRAEPRVDRRVIEDDHVRIEELRVRGQLRRVTVQSKVQGAREYEIVVGHGGRDPSQDRGNAGRSAWRVLGF